MNPKRRVVITGLGVATPIGIGVEPFWDALMARTCGLNRISGFDASGLTCQVGGELPAFSLGEFIPKGYRKSAKVMSRDIQIAVVCAYHAVKDAGINTKCLIDRGEVEGPPNVDSARFGANIGAGYVCADLAELAGALSTAADDDGSFSMAKWGEEGMNNLTPLWLLKFLPNMLACHVTIVHDAQAPSNTLTCGEASSHLAIGEAYRTIARGDADVCICGGAESKTNPLAMMRPQLMNRLNVNDNETPARSCRPFAADRTGMIVAEGGGLVMLESLEHAIGRGARIYGEIAGFGAASSTNHWVEPDPEGRGVELALRNAMDRAGIGPDQVQLINPFGTGMVEHDTAESTGWRSALGDRLAGVPALTTRGALGNNGAGSGAIDFSACVMSLYHNAVPPSINTDNEHFQFAEVGPMDANASYAITLGYALVGGQAAALVIKRYEE